PDFDQFDRGEVPDVLYCGMLQYDGDLKIPRCYLVAPPVIDRTMSEYLCAEEVPTFAISETQKYGHVTYFWSGNRSGYIDEHFETYVEIPSDNIEFDRAPAMKASEIADKTIELLESGRYRFGRINFANGDMVGHTGNLAATIEAVEKVDRCIGRLIEAVTALEGIVVFTADHGNADIMFTEKGGVRAPVTSHTLNPVPFVIVDPANEGDYTLAEVDNPGLANVAATLLNLLGYHAPEDYAPSLIRFPREPHHRRPLYHGAIVNLGLETTRLPNDELLALEIVRHLGGAVIVAVDEKEQVCLIRQFRHAADGWIWELPAGVLEHFEPPVVTAKRELLEEAGLEAKEWQALGPIFTSPGFCTEQLHLFLARDLSHHAPQQEQYEFIEIHWKPMAEALEMAVNGEISDAKTIIGLFRAADRLVT
ncbi:MAG: NUDIX domain-containing protein, partial [Pseudomonadota bacterium]|nr:NUDIX domain-containing protein [Pseudomonadota bacterium]